MPDFGRHYHVRCRFCVGDRYYLCDNKILCEYDYEERLVFASFTSCYGNSSAPAVKHS